MVDRLTWNSILPKAVTGFSSQPLLSAETSYRLHQASCIHSAEWTFIYDVSHHSRFKHRPWHVHMLPSARRTVSVTAWMMTNRQLSFSEWWGLIVYVSAVGSAASVWAGRVIITFIHNLCRTTLRCGMKLNPDWFWIGTHSYTLTSFIKLKPLALIHCHWLCDIHQANTSPTYYIRYQISSIKRTWHCLW